MTAGLDVMTKKSIDGFEGESGVMPPRGGNAILTDEEVTNAVAYMASKLK
jgi:cytochrome c5